MNKEIDAIEKAAAHGSPLPEGADIIDELRWFGLAYIYGCLRKGIFNKEKASTYKQGFVKEIFFLREKLEFGIKCWNTAAKRYKETELARNEYRKNRTLENADKLMAAFDGVEVYHDGE